MQFSKLPGSGQAMDKGINTLLMIDSIEAGVTEWPCGGLQLHADSAEIRKQVFKSPPRLHFLMVMINNLQFAISSLWEIGQADRI